MHPNVKALIEREYAAQKSEEWLALRGNLLTASDAATAIGVNKYENPEMTFFKKCGIGPRFMGNQATRHGEKYEDEARILYEERHGEVVHELGLVPHPIHTWLGGSPDGVTESGKLVLKLSVQCLVKLNRICSRALYASITIMYGDFRLRRSGFHSI
jgi:putative phage-type endonuclease